MYGRGSQMGFGPPVTPPVIKNLLIANGAVYIAQWLPGVGHLVNEYGTVSPQFVWSPEYFQFWRPFTYMWLHAVGSPFHLIFNMLMLWMFGSQLALVWGEQRFLRYYLTCGVGAGVLIATVPWLAVLLGLMEATYSNLAIPTLGASGAVMGVILAFSFTWPDRTLMLIFPPMPIKAIWLIPFMLFIEYASGPSNVSHLGHGGGLLVGWIYLVREGRTPGAPTLEALQHKLRRWRMRQKIRAVHDEEQRKRKRDDDPPYH